MKILLFGASGQLGYEVSKRAHDLNFEVVAPIISEVDIIDAEQVRYLIRSTSPDIIINCAAYTAVDQAQSEPESAFAVNRDGVANIALGAKDTSSKVVHISTDYVFDGSAQAPISEEVRPKPINVYGASKLAGEEILLETLNEKALVVRTSSLHGQKGLNFVHTMIKLFSEREEVQVVNDQFMSPTWAGWLAEVLLDLGRIDCAGVVHASCSGVISWYDFAFEIKRQLPKTMMHKELRLVPVSSSQFQRAAKRPAYSAFDCAKLARLLGRVPIAWQDGLKQHLFELGYIESNK